MERLLHLVTAIRKPKTEVVHRPLQDELSTKACLLFATASQEYPRSVTAQAAKISHELLEMGQTDSLPFMDSLLSDSSKIDSLTKAANAHHQRNGNGPKDQIGLLKLEPENIRSIIRADFKTAHDLMELNPAQIEEILSVYPSFCSRKTHTFSEPSYHAYAYALINKNRYHKGLPPLASKLAPLSPAPTEHLPRR